MRILKQAFRKLLEQKLLRRSHFYSPLVNTKEMVQSQERIWPSSAPELSGIDFNHIGHEAILRDALIPNLKDYDYAEESKTSERALNFFYTQNSQFSWLDSRALFALMRHWKSRRIIEVGSGYSSLLMADVNRRFLNGECHITCIEPYPRPFLKQGVAGITQLIERTVQDVDVVLFDTLEAGDILFIDSSHVCKTGSDVNHLFFEVLPRLKSGVKIHIHDIFLPHEYLKEWVIEENRSWNEQYLLRALLMYSTAFKVVFGCNYAFLKFPDLVRQAINHPKGHAYGGGSFWIERI